MEDFELKRGFSGCVFNLVKLYNQILGIFNFFNLSLVGFFFINKQPNHV